MKLIALLSMCLAAAVTRAEENANVHYLSLDTLHLEKAYAMSGGPSDMMWRLNLLPGPWQILLTGRTGKSYPVPQGQDVRPPDELRVHVPDALIGGDATKLRVAFSLQNRGWVYNEVLSIQEVEIDLASLIYDDHGRAVTPAFPIENDGGWLRFAIQTELRTASEARRLEEETLKARAAFDPDQVVRDRLFLLFMSVIPSAMPR